MSVRILVITGAGVSAESGIPTFRGKDGYWRNLDPAKLATAEAFARDPELIWQWYRERRQRIRNAKPNAAHEAIVKLSTLADDFLLVTQNVDDLHERAEWEAKRLPKEKIVQIHGDIFVTRCSRCDFSRRDRDDEHPPSQSYGVAGEHEEERQEAAVFGVRGHVRAFKAATCRRTPKCPQCAALMRPGVVWFGEQLALNEIERVENYLERGECDLVIVAGTTATFGYIIDWALRVRARGGELIEVNPEETPLSQFATRVVREPAAIALPRIVDETIVSRSSKL